MKFSVEINEKGNGRQVLEFDRPEITIGRVKGNDVILPKGNISKRHSRIIVKGSSFVVVDLKSTNGTYVNGHKLTSPHVLKNGDQIYIGDFSLKVAPAPDESRITSQRTPLPRAPLSSPPPPMPAPRVPPPRTPPPRPLPPPPPPPAPVDDDDGEFFAPIEDEAHFDAPVAGPIDEPLDEPLAEQIAAAQAAVYAVLARREELDQLADDAAAAEQAVQRALNAAYPDDLPAGVGRDLVASRVIGELLGLGPLDRLLDDAAVSKIFANSPHRVFVERDGKIVPCADVFSCAESMLRIIARLLQVPRQSLDQNPTIETRLPDGSQVRALLPPLAADGPVLVLSKPAAPAASLEQLVATGVLSVRMAEFLRTCVRQRKNIVVSTGSGADGVGLLRAIAGTVDGRERIVAVEQVAQLRLAQPNVVNLEVTPIAGEHGASVRNLVRWALRLEPDRLVVADCRGGEALDLLQSMGGPLAGSMLLVHGHSARACTDQLEAMALLGAGDASPRSVRELMVRAIDVVVQVARFADNTSRVTEIAVVNGVEVDLVTMQQIFAFRADSPGPGGAIRGRFLATGAVPHFYEELQQRGEKVDVGLFREQT